MPVFEQCSIGGTAGADHRLPAVTAEQFAGENEFDVLVLSRVGSLSH